MHTRIHTHINTQARVQNSGGELAEIEAQLSKRSAEMDALRKAQAVSDCHRLAPCRCRSGTHMLVCVYTLAASQCADNCSVNCIMQVIAQ